MSELIQVRKKAQLTLPLSEDIHAGRVHSFPDATSAVTHLHSQVGKRQNKTGKRSG